MQPQGIRCTLYSLGYGIYLVDLPRQTEVAEIADSLRESGLYDLMEVIPSPSNNLKAYAITKHGRPPCTLEKNQMNDQMLQDIDNLMQQGRCKNFIRRAILLRQEFGPVIRLVQ